FPPSFSSSATMPPSSTLTAPRFIATTTSPRTLATTTTQPATSPMKTPTFKPTSTPRFSSPERTSSLQKSTKATPPAPTWVSTWNLPGPSAPRLPPPSSLNRAAETSIPTPMDCPMLGSRPISEQWTLIPLPTPTPTDCPISSNMPSAPIPPSPRPGAPPPPSSSTPARPTLKSPTPDAGAPPWFLIFKSLLTSMPGSPRMPSSRPLLRTTAMVLRQSCPASSRPLKPTPPSSSDCRSPVH
ncbi:uncharacterized protein METZ01_LOCUS321651, partial [marine metagenome]